MSTTSSRPTVTAGRERSALRSLVRFVGLTAAAGMVRRCLFGTRERLTVTVGVAGSLVVALVGLVLFVPPLRPLVADVVHAPGGVVQQVIPSTDNQTDNTKVFPRLYSNKLGVDVAVKPGDGRTPPVQPIAYQYPQTAPIGTPGNTYLYAHDRPGMFLGLHRAQLGDVLILAVSPTEKIYYQVTEIHANVAWNDLEWLRPTTDQRLTLQTCNLSGDFDPRYIVVTRQIPVDQGARLTNNA